MSQLKVIPECLSNWDYITDIVSDWGGTSSCLWQGRRRLVVVRVNWKVDFVRELTVEGHNCLFKKSEWVIAFGQGWGKILRGLQKFKIGFVMQQEDLVFSIRNFKNQNAGKFKMVFNYFREIFSRKTVLLKDLSFKNFLSRKSFL